MTHICSFIRIYSVETELCASEYRQFNFNHHVQFIHFSYFNSDSGAQLILIKVLSLSCRIFKSLKKYLFLLMETIYTYLTIVLYSLNLMGIKGERNFSCSEPSGMQFPYYNITHVGQFQ